MIDRSIDRHPLAWWCLTLIVVLWTLIELAGAIA